MLRFRRNALCNVYVKGVLKARWFVSAVRARGGGVVWPSGCVWREPKVEDSLLGT